MIGLGNCLALKVLFGLPTLYHATVNHGHLTPFCSRLVFDCPNLPSPRFGRKSCDFVNRANEIGSTCRFTCKRGW